MYKPKYKVNDCIIYNETKYRVVEVYTIDSNIINSYYLLEIISKNNGVISFDEFKYNTFASVYMDSHSNFDIKEQRKIKLQQIYDNTTMVK